jgi:hypothetical protein
LKFTVEPEIEMEIGTKDTNSTKLDWSLPNMKAVIEASVDDGIKSGLLTGDRDEILDQIFKPWHNKKCLSYLDETYPILNVSLKEEILDVIK